MPAPTTTVTLPADLVRQLQTEADRMGLSLSAYILYLQAQRLPGAVENPGRLDRHVREVFGKHGELMRRLAE